MAPRQCEVCNEAQSKYKCPSCFVPYCSLGCFKKHKESTCKKSSTPVEDLTCADPYTNSSNTQDDLENASKKPPIPVEDLKTLVLPERLHGPDVTLVLPERLYGPDEEDWVLSKESLLSIARSDEIRDALADRDLRDLILKINSSRNAEDELDKAVEEQTFNKFTHKILNIFSPQEEAS